MLDLWRRGRVPVILQMSAIECGAACLAMLLSYYGRKTRLSECRNLLGTGRDGISAYDIITAGQTLGLEMDGYAVAAEDVGELSLPVIAYWENNHFVIIERITPHAIHLVDPGLGRIQLSPEQFADHFAEVVLTAVPAPHFSPRSQNEGNGWLVYIKQMLAAPGSKKLLLQVIVASFSLQLLGLLLPLATKWLVDDILTARLDHLMGLFGLGLLLLMVVQLILSYARAGWLIYLQSRFDSQLMFEFFRHVLTLPVDFFLKRSSGDMLQRLGSNMTIREAFTSNMVATVLDGTLILTYLVILLFWSPLYALLALALGGVQIALLLLTAPQMRFLTERILVNEVKSHSYLLEALSGIVTIKAAGAEDRVYHHWFHLFETHLRGLIQQGQLGAKINTVLQTLRLFSPVLLLWLGVILVLQERMTVGTMLALNALALAFLTPLTSLVQNGQQLQYVGAHLERVLDVLSAAPEQVAGEKPDAPLLSGRVAVHTLSFRYDPHSPLVLQDISFDVAPGQKIAIVGATGSGKSTLALLLLGLYTPTAGSICYDELPLAQVNWPTVRRQWGAVLQHATLFQGSIRDNITLNDRHIPMVDVAAAAQLAVIHDEIEQMPMGYETLVAEAGGGLSGGQRQRLLLARALLHRPRLLLLDEATSHLDGRTEQMIAAHLRAMACTQIIIAHRLTTIRDADLILVLQEGRIVERGRHEYLWAQNGHYVALLGAAMKDETV